MKVIPKSVRFTEDVNLLQRARKLIFWYGKERSIISNIIIITQIGLWHIISKFVKITKNKNSIGFTALYYSGNPRSVFEWSLQHGKSNCYWIARNIKTFNFLKKLGIEKVIYAYSLIGMIQLTSMKVIVTADSYLTILFPQNKPAYIQLWHGIGPKAISHSKENYNICNAWCVPSEYSKKRHIYLWSAPADKLFITGFARMDSLINYLKKSKKEILKELNIQAKQKIVLYAPTFDVGLWPWENKYDEFESLCKYCYNNNLTLIIRFHQFAKLNRKRVKKILRKYKNILWLDMKDETDTMKLLSITDILITDWSSIYTEFFLTKRPIIYLETNKKYFTEKRGKPEIPSSFRAGEIVHSNSEFFHALQTVLNSGNRFIEEQERLLHIIHGAVDGHASKRVFEVINKIIEKL